MPVSRFPAFMLLAAANLIWAGNWVAGRALRDAYAPIELNFFRWAIATAVLAPFALAAGFTLHLLPAFGTILAGVVLATRR